MASKYEAEDEIAFVASNHENGFTSHEFHLLNQVSGLYLLKQKINVNKINKNFLSLPHFVVITIICAKPN